MPQDRNGNPAKNYIFVHKLNFPMRFIANSSALYKKLSLISGLISTNPLQTILTYLHFEIRDQKLKISASDADSLLTVDMEAQEVQHSGETCIPAKLLIEYLRNLSDQPISFQFSPTNQFVEITSDSGKYRISTAPAGEFPKQVPLDEPNHFTLDQELLDYGLRKTLFATSKETLRPAMTGIYFEIQEDEFCMVSTDSHRLIQVSRKGKNALSGKGIIVPKKSADLLLSLIHHEEDPVEMEFDEREALFRGNGFCLSTRLVDATFPAYRTVIPTDNPYTLVLHRLEFLHSLKRISIFANRSTNQMTMEIIGNSVRLMGQDKEMAYEGVETLSCQFNGPDMTLSFNAQLSLELLANMSTEEIRIEMSSPSRACLFRETETPPDTEMLMLLMPLKVAS